MEALVKGDGSPGHPSAYQHSHHQTRHRASPSAVRAAEAREDLPADCTQPPFDQRGESHRQQSHRSSSDQRPQPYSRNYHTRNLPVER